MQENAVSAKIDQIESIIATKNGRDISRMTDWARGNLARAAEEIAHAPNAHVGIVVGFYIKHAEPPSPETDGLNGMAHLAAGLANAGIVVTVITDAPCAKAVWAVVDALPISVGLEIVAVSEVAVDALADRLASDERPITHLIAIERVAPGQDDKPHREHGWDMSRETAPLHRLFDHPSRKRSWYTIGIGDGGNEIGMGSLPLEIVRTSVTNGELIAAKTPADALIIAGVSNWGGFGLLAAIACQKPELKDRLLAFFTAEMDQTFLSAAVHTGQAVDDSRADNPGRPKMSVDRLPWEHHATVLKSIAAIVI
ncbi:DUF4392 domain-containing protein [Methylobacterium sp. WL64]|uniref:glutamate cyclase domain-containing protein n=1 Tax=Methylobacterium sp. WL64 TaxID=2603894 RepID=UPI0011C73EFB|nr:glutamate cyclase domain-containing protein [Methylobacterium sp. WL64]TXM96933.1 DUF4392 domain-containing protein [Methylobacterium sp. WL64]